MGGCLDCKKIIVICSMHDIKFTSQGTQYCAGDSQYMMAQSQSR